MTKGARIIFFGTPEFAVPVLRALVQAGYPIVGVVSQPDRPVGRNRVLTPTPVKKLALELNLPVIQPERIRDQEAFEVLAGWQPDFLITAAYGQLIPNKILHLPRVAALNVHASLLPDYRGASPIQRAILHGDTETGVSIMTMVMSMDAGPVWSSARLLIRPNENYGELSERLAQLGSQLLIATLPSILDHSLVAKAQDESAVTFAPRLTRQDEWLDFQTSAINVANKIRALAPAPGASVWLDDKVLKVWYATPVESVATKGIPGQVLDVGEQGLLVACVSSAIWIHRLQAAGKKAMSGLEFSRGHRNVIGSVFSNSQRKGDRD